MKQIDSLLKILNKFDAFPFILIIFILIISIMSPIGSGIPVQSPAKDLLNHISGIIEARNALTQGQFPIRVAPNALEGMGYPIFQFYGNFPYTLGALFFILTNDPYLSLKIVIFLSLFLGAYYLYKFGIWTTNNKYAAITASVIYLTAPYVLTDIHGRFAFPEIVALGLIPVIFYYMFQCFYSKNICYYILLTFFSVLLFYTHNIFALFTLLFLVIFLIFSLVMNGLEIYNACRIFISMGFAFIMASWYLVPQLLLANILVIQGFQNNPFDTNYLSTLWVLLAPSKILPLPSNYFDNPNLGFQIGYPLLTFIVCGMIVLISKQYSGSNENNDLKNTHLLKLLVFCSIISLILIWSPINFWTYFPNQFLFIQFPYRILGYLVIFGAMITPIAIVRIFNDFKLQHAIIICLICISFTSTYLPNHIGEPKDSIQKEISNPEMGRGGATTVYQMSKVSLTNSNVPYGEKKDLIQGYTGGWLLENASLSLKRSEYANQIFLRINGTVPEYTKDLSLKFFVNGKFLQEIKLPEGSFMYDIPINNLSRYDNAEKTSPQTGLTIGMQSNKYFIPNEINSQSSDKRQLSLLLASFEIFETTSSADEYISATDPQIKKVSWNEIIINSSTVAIAELPVLYYPGMLKIYVNGMSVPYFNIGNKIGIQVEPGTSLIKVDFVGSEIANYISAISWLIFGLFCLICLKKMYFEGIKKNDN